MLTTVMEIINYFTVTYPLAMTSLWILGALFSWLIPSRTLQAQEYLGHPVTIIVAAFNEEKPISQTLKSIRKLHYPDIRVIVVDDCSSDKTLDIMVATKKTYDGWPELKILHAGQNGGKARALNLALPFVQTELFMVIDADSMLEKNAVHHLTQCILDDDKTAAVTGRPIVRNRTTLLGKLQSLEYLAIIDSIKRTQNLINGTIMTVSRVIVMYKTHAVHSVGGFSPNAMTEDIAVTWSLSRAGWKIKYCDSALSYILMPETLRSLLKQRERWALGGVEVAQSNSAWVFKRASPRYFFLLLENYLSHLWCWSLLASLTFFGGSLLFTTERTHLPGQTILLFCLLSFLLFGVGMLNDRRKSLLSFSDATVVPIYVAGYWLVNFIACLRAELHSLTNTTTRGRWISPDRGI